MQKVYLSSTSKWPLLQSKTEQKFKSGLFNVSAEFIRPVGNSNLPTKIETSIGLVDVWPEPTVSVGTDGFERINATGYGVWDSNISEVVIGLQLGQIKPEFKFFQFCSNPNGCGVNLAVFPCGEQYPLNSSYNISVSFKDILFETVFVKKIGYEVPAPPLPLKIYDLNGAEISSQKINFIEFQPFLRGFAISSVGANPNDKIITPNNTSGTFLAPIQTITKLTQVSRVNYGEIIETSATYEILSCFVDYGTFLENSSGVNCSP
jgi:hypothetical protein